MIEWREIKNKKEPSGSFFASGLCVAVNFFHLLQVADFLRAGIQLCHDLLQRQASFGQQNHQVIEQVADLAAKGLVRAVFGRDDDLPRLLCHFFENLIQALLEEIAGVGALGRALPAALDDVVQRF